MLGPLASSVHELQQSFLVCQCLVSSPYWEAQLPFLVGLDAMPLLPSMLHPAQCSTACVRHGTHVKQLGYHHAWQSCR